MAIIIFGILTNDSSVSIYGSPLWEFIPCQWRSWLLDEVKEIECYMVVTLDSHKPYFIGISLDIGSFKSDIESFDLGRLISGVNKFLFPNILCPWGCTKYIHMAGNIQMDIVIQPFLRKLLLAISNDHDEYWFVHSCREYCIQDKKIRELFV